MSFHTYMYGQYKYHHDEELRMRDFDDRAAEEAAVLADKAMEAILSTPPTDLAGINVLMEIAAKEADEASISKGGKEFGLRALKAAQTALELELAHLKVMSAS